jgi:GMP synthase-like glutamine amidotransferase
MLIAIIETGVPPEPLKGRHGDYPAMMARMLAPFAPQLSFSTAHVARGDRLPAVADFDGLLITGSAAGVYEGHAWIAPLEELVRETANAGKPQVGICFGHQLMAQAFGGKVEKSDKGWGVGVHRYRVTGRTDWMIPELSQIACAVSHQDQVVEAPSGARVLAGSDFCPNGAIAYAQGKTVSFQMHPEFEHAYASDLLRLRADRLAQPLVENGLESLARASDRGRLAQWIANFFVMA